MDKGGGPALIAVDWGTSNFRAYLVAAGGAVLDRRAGDGGLLALERDAFEGYLADHIADWRAAHGDLPVMMSGMVGSRLGWHEAPYVDCPAGPAALAGALVEIPNRIGLRVGLVPGLVGRGDGDRAEAGPADVMRGEETQIVGHLRRRPGYAGAILLPGTHSKCARVGDGRILGFKTAMTGELFDLLCRHSILGQTMDEAEDLDADAVGEGLARGLEHGGALLHELFAVRTRTLVEDRPTASNRGYLSGLLIGAELCAARATLAAQTDPVPLIGGPALTALYARALAKLGLDAEPVAAETALVDGLLAIAEAHETVAAGVR